MVTFRSMHVRPDPPSTYLGAKKVLKLLLAEFSTTPRSTAEYFTQEVSLRLAQFPKPRLLVYYVPNMLVAKRDDKNRVEESAGPVTFYLRANAMKVEGESLTRPPRS